MTEADNEAIAEFPELSTLTAYLSQIENGKGDIGLSMKFIIDNRKDILKGSAFKTINEESVKHMNEVIKIYEEEYERRFKSVLTKRLVFHQYVNNLELPSNVNR